MQPYRVKTITEYHRAVGLPDPEHPLISIIDIGLIRPTITPIPSRLVFDFYCISIKRNMSRKMKYGRQDCDFDGGVFFAMAPNQVWGLEIDLASTVHPSGKMILLHPDLLWNTPLAATVRKYEYFNYEVNEALYLSDKEEQIINGIIDIIEREYHNNIDKFSGPVIIAQLEVIFTYADRFYHRQFLTRRVTGHQVVKQMEKLLAEYFDTDKITGLGLPSVNHFAKQLNMSPGYLSELLKALTGETTQQHIHNKLIEKAKEKLSTTELSVSEIAYELGFEHLQSFSKLFKAKTNMSPAAFRASFN